MITSKIERETLYVKFISVYQFIAIVETDELKVMKKNSNTITGIHLRK